MRPSYSEAQQNYLIFKWIFNITYLSWNHRVGAEYLRNSFMLYKWLIPKRQKNVHKSHHFNGRTETRFSNCVPTMHEHVSWRKAEELWGVLGPLSMLRKTWETITKITQECVKRAEAKRRPELLKLRFRLTSPKVSSRRTVNRCKPPF